MLREVVDKMDERYYGDGDLEGLREDIMRSLAFDFEIDQQTFARLGEDGVADKVFDEAVKFYHRKRQSLAAPFREIGRASCRESGRRSGGSLSLKATETTLR